MASMILMLLVVSISIYGGGVKLQITLTVSLSILIFFPLFFYHLLMWIATHPICIIVLETILVGDVKCIMSQGRGPTLTGGIKLSGGEYISQRIVISQDRAVCVSKIIRKLLGNSPFKCKNSNLYSE